MYRVPVYPCTVYRVPCTLYHVPPVHVQFMYLSARMRRYFAGGIYRRYCRYIYIFKCVLVPVPVPVQTFVLVPDASVSSVHHYRYRKLRYVCYDISTGTGNFGKFGTSIPVQVVLVYTFVPVPNTSVSSVHVQYRYRTLR